VAELYPPGIQRIYYKAVKDTDDLIITAKILDPNYPNSEVVNLPTFEKVSEVGRIYFTEINFYMEGIWIAVFSENDVETAVQAYNTKRIPSEVKRRSGNLLNG